MGCCCSCGARDDDDEFPPLSGGSDTASSGYASVPPNADDLRGRPAGGPPRRIARRRSKTFTEGSAATGQRGKKKVRHWSFGGCHGARGSSYVTATADIAACSSIDARAEEAAIREFFGPEEEV